MKELKILVCFGTRPEAIKMAPVIQELEIRNINHKVCVTSQHREMLDQVLSFFEIKPDFDLNLMRKGQSLNSLSSLILGAIDEVLDLYSPDLILVQGDTTTAAMIAMAAFHRNIKVGHVEAGLRTNNKKSPFPEEINRQLIGRIADFHFAPTQLSVQNLLKENISAENVYMTGNTVVDALEWATQILPNLPENEEIRSLGKFLKSSKKLILVTGHRRENLGKGIEQICEALLVLSNRDDVQIVYPVHLNPLVTDLVSGLLGNRKNILLASPVTYPTMIWLLSKAYFVITDSGGIQEEVPFFKKPVLITRDTTERSEGVEAGFGILTGTGTNEILKEAQKLFDEYPNLNSKVNPYGDGKASEKIVNCILDQKKE